MIKKINLLFIAFLLIQLSCKKVNPIEQTPKTIDTKYRIYDSVIKVFDNMNGGVITQENHFVLNRDIIISKNSTSGELVYNSDTFIIHQNTPIIYSNKNGSFPLLGFNNDSLSIYRHLGGVGYQTWEYLQCAKY